MTSIIPTLYANAARIAALFVIFASYQIARLPELSQTERVALAAEFSFAEFGLHEPTGYEYLELRPNLHPDLAHLSAWFSGLGASVALNDLDGDGLPNDVCAVEIRINQVVISPAPNTPDRYEPFILDHAALPQYDPIAHAPIGCLPNDMNEDGYTDLLIYYWGRSPVAFLHSGAAEISADTFTPQEIVADIPIWNSSAATFSDLDGDGHSDLIIANYFQDGKVILGDEGEATLMQRSLSKAFNGGANHILLWESADENSVTYREVEWTDNPDVIHAWTLAVGSADLDGDLLPEIYFSNDYGPDRLLHNRSTPGNLQFTVLEGERNFTTPRSSVVGEDSFKGMGIDFGDVNNDGLYDMYISNIAADYSMHESHFLYVSTGEEITDDHAPYVQASEDFGVSRSGWSWESRLADFNNDATLEALQATGFHKGEIDRWPDMQELGLGNDELTEFPATWPVLTEDADLFSRYHNPFFVQSESGRFFDIAPELGLGDPTVSRGIATADVDGDGDLDFAVAHQWATSSFYQNNCPNCDAFLGLNLLLPVNGSAPMVRAGHPGADTIGRPAIGAHATVTLPDGTQRIGFIDGGNGQAGARSSDLHFGLGDIAPATPVTVELRWRGTDGTPRTQSLNLTAGWHTIVLGD